MYEKMRTYHAIRLARWVPHGYPNRCGYIMETTSPANKGRNKLEEK